MIRRLHAKYINSTLGRKKASTQWMYFIFFVLVLWFAVGMLTRPSRREAREEPGMMKVEVERLASKRIMSDVVVYGHTEANQRVNLKVRTSGIVEKIVKSRGAKARKGDVVLRLRMDDRIAKSVAAEAAKDKANMEFATAKRLLADDLISKVEYISAEAAMKQAAYAAEQAGLDVEYASLKAPFDGVVNSVLVEEGQYVASGENVGVFLDLGNVKIVGEIPEKYIGRASIGNVASVMLSDGRTIEAVVVYVASRAGAATRTFEVMLSAPNPGGAIKDGLTAEIRLPLDAVSAVRLPATSCLTFGDDGAIGVKTIGADGVVGFYPVELVREDGGGLWVSGLPDEVDVIVVGQEFVRIGEKAEPKYKNPVQ